MTTATRSIGSAVLLVMISFGTTTNVFTQDKTRYRQNLIRPILRPNSEIPLGTVRELVFHEDGRGQLWLFAGGDDKLIRKWLVRSKPYGQVQL